LPATWKAALDGNRDQLIAEMSVSTSGLLNHLADLQIINSQERESIKVSISVFYAFT